ncbi:MAG: uroporphyrinogen-III synthase [Turneriella sp.]|nr:uroporphyrinogen-III synthase [Turneriella sp.]
MAEIPIRIATRDSLLALAQTIVAAQRLERVGFRPQLIPLKTAGDLELQKPLYEVARMLPQKEGRAFFTRELDAAVAENRADAAVHSFKDLPTERPSGIFGPIFFAEELASDLLLLREGDVVPPQGKGLVIGTSSLRRIHQLGLLFVQAQVVPLRGNLITRLEKLARGDSGINALAVAAAGVVRLQKFAALDEKSYAHFLNPKNLGQVRQQLARFADCSFLLERAWLLPERFFPTAAGQGVLALELRADFYHKHKDSIMAAFPEHSTIASRVHPERQILSDLATGCHAPLGVSVSKLADGKFAISACYAEQSPQKSTDFQCSRWLERRWDGQATPITLELQNRQPIIYWWGTKTPPIQPQLAIVFIRAVEQKILPAELPPQLPENIFVASETAARWLNEKTLPEAVTLYAAGKETAKLLSELFPQNAVCFMGKGFAALLAQIPPTTPLLWLGSKEGLARARRLAEQFPNTDFLAVYENHVLVPQGENIAPDGWHAITSASAAEAFVRWHAAKNSQKPPRLYVFGESAADVLLRHGYAVCHTSEAVDFGGFVRELACDPTLLAERFTGLIPFPGGIRATQAV